MPVHVGAFQSLSWGCHCHAWSLPSSRSDCEVWCPEKHLGTLIPGQGSQGDLTSGPEGRYFSPSQLPGQPVTVPGRSSGGGDRAEYEGHPLCPHRGAPWGSCVLQSVVAPRCRGTAEALQITVGHILGDASSPYLTGLVRLSEWGVGRPGDGLGAWQTWVSPWQLSSALRARRPDSYLQRFLSLQQSFLCCAFVIVLGGGCFLLTALYLEGDQAQAQQPGTGNPAAHIYVYLEAGVLAALSLSPWPAYLFHSLENMHHTQLYARQGCGCQEVTQLSEI